MKFKNKLGEEVEAFRWTIDVTPDWWTSLLAVQIQTETCTAIIPPSGTRAEIGNYIIRHPDFSITVMTRENFEAEYSQIVEKPDRGPERPVTLRGPGEGKSYRRRFWEEWTGKKIVIQCKGRVIIIGTLQDFENGFLRIEDAQIKGIRNLARVRTLMVDRDHVGHFHEPGELEQLEISKTVHDPQWFETPKPDPELVKEIADSFSTEIAE